MSSNPAMTPQQISQLIVSASPSLTLFARQWSDTPEDVVQEAFLKLVRMRIPPRDVLPWLYRVVRTTALDASKMARRRQKREEAVAQTASWFIEPEIDGLDAETAVRLLQQRPLEQREVIIAHLWGGLTFEEIADVAGCSVSTAFRRYSAGIDALREHLGVVCPKELKPRTIRSSSD